MVFNGGEDAKMALSWIQDKLGEAFSLRAGMKQEQIHVLQETYKQVGEVFEEVSAEGYNYSSRSRFYDDLWERFIFSYSGKWPDDQDERWEPPFQFGEWERQGARDLDFGYSPNGSLISVSIPEAAAYQDDTGRFQNLWFGDFSQSSRRAGFSHRDCEGMRDRCCLLCSADACRDGAVEATGSGQDKGGRRVATSRG